MGPTSSYELGLGMYGLTLLNDDVCSGCVLGIIKQIDAPVHKVAYQAHGNANGTCNGPLPELFQSVVPLCSVYLKLSFYVIVLQIVQHIRTCLEIMRTITLNRTAPPYPACCQQQFLACKTDLKAHKAGKAVMLVCQAQHALLVPAAAKVYRTS